MDAADLDSLLTHFVAKIQMIHDLMPLVKLCDANRNWRNQEIDRSPDEYSRVKDEQSEHNGNWAAAVNGDKKFADMESLTNMVLEMKVMIDSMKTMVENQRRQMTEQDGRMRLRIQSIREHLFYLRSNIPSFMVKDSNGNKENTANIGNNTRRPVTSKVNASNRPTSKPAAVTSIPPVQRPQPPKVLLNKNKNKKPVSDNQVYLSPLTVEFITMEEFATIPQYMRGRLTFEGLNKGVIDFNTALEAKYKLLASQSSSQREEDTKKCQLYKSQENSETNGQFFCVMPDLRELSDLKVDSTTRTVLTCLRHCKRLKEIRGPAKIIRYAVMRK